MLTPSLSFLRLLFSLCIYSLCLSLLFFLLRPLSFFFCFLFTACIYSQAKLGGPSHASSSQPCVLGMKSQPFDGVRLPLRPLPLAGTGGTKSFPLAAACFVQCKDGRNAKNRKWQETAAEEGKRLQTGVQYHAY